MMASQLDLFAAQKRRDEAIALVHAGADPDWFGKALGAVRVLANTRNRFTTDELWSMVPSPTEPRALGAVMQEARRLGLVEPTDQTIPSARPRCHARPVRVWRSLVGGSP